MVKRIFVVGSVLVFFLLSGSILLSCHKNKGEISIRGQVFDPNTNVNVEGATVILSASKIVSGVYSSGYSELDRTTTDANGSFSFDFKEQKVVGYQMYITNSGYFSFTKDISSDDITAGETYSPTYDLYPIGYIKLNVYNQSPFDTADFISYSFSSGYLICYECCDNSIHYGHGIQVNDSLKCKTNGNHDVTFIWNVTKNHQTIQHSGSVYCRAFDTTAYNIFY
jgi:hypothetical protein